MLTADIARATTSEARKLGSKIGLIFVHKGGRTPSMAETDLDFPIKAAAAVGDDECVYGELTPEEVHELHRRGFRVTPGLGGVFVVRWGR